MNALSSLWNLCLNVPYSDGGYENSSRVMSPSFDMLQDNKTDKHWPTLKAFTKTYPSTCINDPTTVPNKGWGVELALPISGIVYNTTSSPSPKPGDFWRINFSRVEWRVLTSPPDSNGGGEYYYKDPSYPNEDNWVWSPMGVVDMHEPDKWGIVQFAHPQGGETAAAGETGEDGKGERTVPKVTPVSRYGSWGCREVLMNVYYAQKSFYASYKKYTSDLNTLDSLAPVEGACLKCGKVEIEVYDEGWMARTEVGGWRGTVNQVRKLMVEEIGDEEGE